MKKVFEKGLKYRPVVTVEKVKNGKATVLKMSGERYILDHKDRGRGK